MKYFTACLLLFLAFTVSGEEAKVPHVILQTSFGPIEIELNPAKAPESVETFLTYVKEGFYEGTIFHRVINNFVVQGGGYTADFKKKDTHPSIPNEAANGLKNLRSTVALARSNDPHSANSQFFINVRDNKFLDYKSSTTTGWGYCVFGKVVEGMEVVDKIAKIPTDSGGPFKRDVPQTTITIDAVKVEYVAPTDWVTSAGGPDKPATETKPTSEEKKKPEPSMADMQQDMLSMDMDEDGKSPAEKDKSGNKAAGDKSPQEAKPTAKATAEVDDQATEADDQTANTKVGKKIATPAEAKTKSHPDVKTDKKPVPEKKDKLKPAAEVSPEEKSSMNTEEDKEEKSESATTSTEKKIAAGIDQKSDAKTGKEVKAAATEDAKVATPADAKTKVHYEAKTDKELVSEKKDKLKPAAADDAQEEDISSKDMEEEDSKPATASTKQKLSGSGTDDKKSSATKTGKDSKDQDMQEDDISSKDMEEDDSEPATTSDKKKIPGAGTDKISSEVKTGKDFKAHNEAKTGLRPVPEKQGKPKTAAEEDMSTDMEEAKSETATTSEKKAPGVGTDKKSADAKMGKESKATIEKKPSTVTKANERDSSEQTAVEGDTAPRGVVKTEHSAKTTPDESSPKKMLKEGSAAMSKQEKDIPTATPQSSPNQPATKAELEKKAVASIDAPTEEKTRVKPGEKASVGKSTGRTTPPPDSPTPPDKPEPVAY